MENVMWFVARLSAIVAGVVVTGFLLGKPVSDETLKRKSVKIVAQTETGFMQGTGTEYLPGLILTNHHVIDGGTQLTVEKYGVDSFVPAVVVSSDPAKDLAVLLIPSNGLGRVSTNNDFKLGDKIAIVGNPMFTDFKMAHTKITNMMPYPDHGKDAMLIGFPCENMRPGFSGGGVYNQAGELIGVAERGMFDEEHGVYECFAIPIREAL